MKHNPELKIDTSRCIIRPMRSEDVMDLYQLDKLAIVHKYIEQKPVENLSQMQDIVLDILAQYKAYGIGRWVIELKELGRVIGWTGLRYYPQMGYNKHHCYYDFGYRLHPDYWGLGIATETGQATLQYLKPLVKPIYATTDARNQASNHVLTKLGFKMTEEYEWEGRKALWFSFV